ncbi:hypothetical protein IAT38_004273 [Cryptococcus sp. DSM 104549]
MLAARRQSMASPGPMSPTSLPRPSSATGHNPLGHTRARLSSDAASVAATITAAEETRNVKVVLRIRPSNPDDPSIPPRFRSVLVHPTSQSEIRVDVDPATLAGQGSMGPGAGSGKRHPTFTFDSVLGEDAQQLDLYGATARESVDEFMKGHNVTFLAYGQTSSGKSYSMGTTGEDIDYSGTEFTPRTGLIPRTVHTIFERAEEIKQQSGPGASWEARLSFLELYNEEIIDLLSGSGVAITIREERDGRIVWSGVREVKVKSLGEVMQLLQEGSERRKTGETTMNATSSRSHAIFSLTLVQKKRAGAGAGASGVAASGRETPTRQLRRPSSTIGFPGAARSPTPTSSRNIPPSSFSRMAQTPTRPSSVVGTPVPADGEYVIVTSKFNMVDLAGSERLKRTAAQGDRMKEGISINSGLLALGNVISTLCDPVKARGHIPYRDSKLTRMLQDSIGGNALTTMIACVSPIEANIGETLNTIKYASRARNIRNVAKVNQIEAGWDDVEHLQTSVLKLRKQLAMMEADGKGAGQEEGGRQSEKLIQRLAELQREHTELYDRYLAKCSDNMRLSSELRNRGPGDGDALAKFNETVEPVILEYEKVVSALNQQLDELRGELVIMSDLSEEHTRQLQDARTRQTQSETYVSELRSRLAKLTERNTSSEAYIHDLEAKLKTHSDKEESHADVVAELKKEITKLRENGAAFAQHTSELEARLAKSEAQCTGLVAQIEKQEKDAEHREAAYRDLEAHIVLLDTSKDNKRLVEELAERDSRIAELQLQLDEKASSEERERELLEAVQAERSAQDELRSRLASLQASVSSTVGTVTPPTEPVSGGTLTAQAKTPIRAAKELTPPESPSSSHTPAGEASELEELRLALKQLSAKYDEAESRVADLTTQLSESKLIHAEMDDMVPLSPALPSPGPQTPREDEGQGSDDEEESETGTMVQTPRGSTGSQSPMKRRTSMPILSNSGGGGGVGVKSGFRGGRGYGDSKRIRPQSLSQELSSAQSSASSPRAGWTPPSSSLISSSPTNPATPRASLRSSQSLEAELKFVHRIIEERDEELKDREACIRQLEEQLEQTHSILSRETSAETSTKKPQKHTPKTPSINVQIEPADVPLPLSPRTPVRPLAVETREVEAEDLEQGKEREASVKEVDEGDDKEKGLKPPEEEGLETGALSPKSVKRFSALADSLSRLENGQDVEDEQTRIQNLMREMAEKEASQRRIIEQQFIQIADLQKANNKLKEDIAETEPQDVTELEKLRHERDLLIAEKTKSPAASPIASPARSANSDAALDRLREEHAEELQSLITGHAQTIGVLQTEHEVELLKLRDVLAKNETIIRGHEATIEQLKLEHSTSMTKLREAFESSESTLRAELDTLKSTHAQATAELESAHARAMEAIQAGSDLIATEMESSLSTSEEQRRQLKMKADQALFELSRVRDEHALQRNSHAKQVADLTKATAQLEKARAELEVANAELKSANAELKGAYAEVGKRNGELEQRFSRKSHMQLPPPQGPPPTTPLPPIPRSPSVGMLKLELSPNPNTAAGAGAPAKENGKERDSRQSQSSAGHSGHSETISEAGAQTLYKVLAERDGAIQERDGLRKEVGSHQAKVKEIESKLQEEKVKVNNLTIDLREASRTTSKLRAHMEEARQESKRTSEACREHTSELEARREQMSKLSEQEQIQRASLQAAKAQVASLQAQLERAVDKKVAKRGLRCF